MDAQAHDKRDANALLSFRKAVTWDPGGKLSNWTARNSSNICSWYGILVIVFMEEFRPSLDSLKRCKCLIWVAFRVLFQSNWAFCIDMLHKLRIWSLSAKIWLEEFHPSWVTLKTAHLESKLDLSANSWLEEFHQSLVTLKTAHLESFWKFFNWKNYTRAWPA